jgi:glutamate/tyrosine decarboxylase-like PLP-dependent enzyme
MAHVTALAAARHDVLRTAGWDVAAAGLSGAPPIRVVTGEKRHVTVDRALRLIGIGSDAIDIVPVDAGGRASAAHIADRLAVHRGPTIVVAQAGEVNTGSFDPISAIAAVASEHGAWLHVDGAFGIWARVSERLEPLAAGLEQADSWAFDAHKWLNVPYDSGVAVVAHPESHRASMLGPAAYLAATGSERDAYDWTAEASRRARGFAIYAALRSLGRSGVTDLVDRCCSLARRFAERLAALPGCEIVNDVSLNQVLIRFGDDATTSGVLGKVQRGGVAWMGGTTWDGRAAIRISVSSWATTVEDVDRTVAAFAAAVA